MRKAMRRVLEAEGYVTEAFSTAEDFLAKGAFERTSCLVLDIQLPGVSGFELHRMLRASGSAIPTIFITGQEERLRGAATAGAECCLVKPFPPEKLLQCVERSIAK